MSEFNREGILRLLDSAGSIIDKHDLISHETGSKFNVFEVANIGTDERIVCRILYELLSPTGNHGQRSAYLALFLRDCLGQNYLQSEIDKALVYREYRARGRPIDIMIKISNRFIPIEVKIYAPDQERQCYDYFQFVQAESRGIKTRVVYLTIDGRCPSEDSSGDLDDDDIHRISFSHDIIDWLEKCLSLPETIRKAPIREVIMQFISTIRHFSNQLEDKPMEDMIKLLSESEQNMRNAKAIADSLEVCRGEMIKKFYDAFHDRFRGTLERVVHNVDYTNGESKFPGIAYIAKADVEPDISILFALETSGYDPLLAGFTFTKNGERVADKKIAERLRTHFTNIDGLRSSDWWSFWEYITFENERIDLVKANGHINNYFKLFDPIKFDLIVDSAVEQAKRILEKLKD